MISLGVLLVILGVGSLVLPNLGFQFQLMEFVDPYQPWAGIIVAALGLITILFGAQRRGRKEVVVESAAAAPAAAATTAAAEPPQIAPAPERAPTADAVSTAAPPPPAPPSAPESEPWPTQPPERSDDD
jgi:predicted lipid-binding transport protein (Tim44 family)